MARGPMAVPWTSCLRVWALSDTHGAGDSAGCGTTRRGRANRVHQPGLSQVIFAPAPRDARRRQDGRSEGFVASRAPAINQAGGGGGNGSDGVPALR